MIWNTIVYFQGTVLIKSADELMKFSRGEENLLEEQIKSLKEAGVDVIVSGGKFGDLALHYTNKYDMLAVRLQSKFDVRRVSKTVNATALPKLVSTYSFLQKVIWMVSFLNVNLVIGLPEQRRTGLRWFSIYRRIRRHAGSRIQARRKRQSRVHHRSSRSHRQLYGRYRKSYRRRR